MNNVETVRLHPADPAQLLAWLERFNAAANWLSSIAFRERLWHWLPLQRRAYREARERFQLPAAATVVVIRKVAYAYRNKQRRQHQATFRRRGAIPVYRHRYKRAGTVSLYGFRIPFTAPRHICPVTIRRSCAIGVASSSCIRLSKWTSRHPPPWMITWGATWGR
jgi:hypothetical protein